ncbi:MAG: hypothetical protein ABI390_05955 [Daejeonella sp.]
MKLNIFCLPALMLIFASCTNSKQIKRVEVTDSPDSISGCYSYSKNNDLVSLSIKDTAGIIIGNLAYNIYEKDSNTGTINGKMKGDTLLADYTFQSEGTESVRQVAFLRSGKNFQEGFGEVEERNGKTVFKNPNTLTFENMILEPVPCEK